MIQIVVTLLLLFLPGYFILNISRNNRNGFWLQVTYSHALSLIYLIGIGLAVNTILPRYGITDPLSPVYLSPAISLVTSIIVLISLLLGIKNIKSSIHKSYLVFERSKFHNVFILLFLVIPAFVTVSGTLVLNSSGSNELLLFGICLLTLQIILSFFLSTFFHHKDFFFLYSLLLIACGTIFMTSFRGQLVTGSDIMLEYRTASITQANQIWHPHVPDHPYTACLSITILPVVISNLGNISLNWIFKFVLQFTTIFSVVPVYYVARKYSSEKYSYIATVAYLAFPSFFGIMPMHLRQSAAILFFFLTIHLIVTCSKRLSDRLLLYVFAFGMVVSHYSTTYLATAIYLAFFFCTLFFYICFRFVVKIKKMDNTLQDLHFFRYINPIFIVFLCLCIYTWYFKVTTLSGGLSNFVQKVAYSFSSDSKLDIRENTSIINQFNIFFKQTQEKGVEEEYVETIRKTYDQNNLPTNNTFYKFTDEELENFKLNTLVQKTKPSYFSVNILRPIFIGADVIKKMYKVLTIVGVIFVGYSFMKKKGKDYDITYLLVLAISFTLLIAFTSLPLFTIDYDVFRTYHQLLIVLALMPVLGLLFILKMIKLPFRNSWIIIFFAFYFTLSTGFFYEVIGGYAYSLVLDNAGDDYSRYFIPPGDVLSVKWIEKNRGPFAPIHTDTYNKQKLRALSNENLPAYDEMTTLSITRQGYVYLSTANLQDGSAYKNLNNRLIKHTIPINFISEQKDKIYSNSKSEIYK